MTDARFEAWRRGGVERGQRRLADTLRLLIYKTAPNLFDGLDFGDDRSFLDPLLFAYFTDPAPSLPLAQLLYGLTVPQRRPPSVELRTDAHGQVYLPGIGELKTSLVTPLDYSNQPYVFSYPCFAKRNLRSGTLVESRHELSRCAVRTAPRI